MGQLELLRRYEDDGHTHVDMTRDPLRIVVQCVLDGCKA